MPRVLQPRSFEAFRCIGADCEDTCCVGWIVSVDKPTYEKYQNCSDADLGPSMRTLVTINGNPINEDDYARIVLNGSACPFLSDGLCSTQLRLGEEYLSNTCAAFPRVVNRVDEVLQRSLDLSCPEAARLVLLNPRPIEFDEQECEEGSIRLGAVPALDISGYEESGQTYRVFRDARQLAISILQDRSYPIWQRLFLLGRHCTGIPGDLPAASTVNPMTQLEVVLELIVGRIVSDATSPRFLECYKDFMEGVEWTAQSTMEQIAARYGEAYSQHYASFMSEHEYMLEHYLVSYVHRTLFPFGIPDRNRKLRNDRVPSLIAAQYMLLIAYYAITRTLLIGMARRHKSAFEVGHVIKLMQTATKTFEHSDTYPARMIEMLADRGMITPASLSVLVRN